MNKRLLMIGCRGEARLFWTIGLLVISLAFCLALAHAYSFLSSEKAAQPHQVAERKADVKSQLQELEKSNMSDEERANAQDALGKFFLVLTALVASVVPTVRALRVDPLQALRHE